MSISAPTIDSTIWIPPIVKTVATEGKGIDELAASIAKHAEHLRQSGDWAARDRARLGSEMETLLREALMDRFLENIQQQKYEEMIENVVNRNISPSEAVISLLNGNLK
jgi:LAO/AO transport system kinase